MVAVLRKVGLMHRRKLRGTREASNGGRMRMRIIHGLTLVIKNSHTYCKSLLVIKQSMRRMLLGERLVGVNHRALPTLTQRSTIIKQIMLRLRYITVHHTCMLRESQTSTQVSLQFTTTHQHDSYITISIISKLYARNQTSHSIQCT